MLIAKKRASNQLRDDFFKSPAAEKLNEDQSAFFEAFFRGDNVLLTGPAGVGKSYCLTALFDYLMSRDIFVGKAALTGVAALNIQGSTIHSWAGLGLADEDIDSVVQKASQNKGARKRIRGTPVLFIDEISMASADLLTKLDAVLKNVRMNREPFGGMQIVFSGDFLQLPPVFKGFGEKVKFAFQSHVWNDAGVKTSELTKLVRQDETTPFAKMLQEIRFGGCPNLPLLESRIDAKLDTELDPIRIFCKNVDIDVYNNQKYNAITGPEQVYVCRDTGILNEKYSAYFDKNCPAPPILRLKAGAQVMLLTNLDVNEGGLVNGSMGVVTGFSPLGPIVKFTNGTSSVIETHKWEVKEQEEDVTGKMRYKVVATRNQVPLRLAWATSVHKQQGATLDQAVVDLGNAFEYGMVYTALSRVKDIEGLSLVSFNPRLIKAHPDCLDFYQRNQRKSDASC